jgi:hypothetical protein
MTEDYANLHMQVTKCCSRCRLASQETKHLKIQSELTQLVIGVNLTCLWI